MRDCAQQERIEDSSLLGCYNVDTV